MDRLDGRIAAEFFDARSKEWLGQQNEIETRMKLLATAPLCTAAEAVQIMRRASDASGRFHEVQPDQHRKLAITLLNNATWEAGKFESDWKSPFDVLALSNSVSQAEEREKPGSGREIEIWLAKNIEIKPSRIFCKLLKTHGESQG